MVNEGAAKTKMQRSVKKTPSGVFFVGSASKVILCEACGRDECDKRQTAEMIGVTVDVCDGYLVPLRFEDQTGVRGAFMTLRFGIGTAGKLDLGQLIAVSDKDGNLLFQAKVTAVSTLPWDDMLAKHGHENHLVANRHDLTDDEKRELVTKVVTGFFGGFKKSAKDPQLTAVWLEEQ